MSMSLFLLIALVTPALALPNVVPRVPVQSQTIIIYGAPDMPLSISEVELYTSNNVLLTGDQIVATVSSSAFSIGLPPAGLFDGNKTSVWPKNMNDPSPLTHTNGEKDHHIKMDVQTAVPITRVVYYGRTDCCTERMININVTTVIQGKEYACSEDLGNLKPYGPPEKQVYGCTFSIQSTLKMNVELESMKGPSRLVNMMSQNNGKYCGAGTSEMVGGNSVTALKCDKSDPTVMVLEKLDNLTIALLSESYYCSDDTSLFCNRGILNSWAAHSIEEDEFGIVSLKGGRSGKYCAWKEDQNGIICDQDLIGSLTKYTFTFDIGYQNSTFPSMEQGESHNLHIMAKNVSQFCTGNGRFTYNSTRKDNSDEFILEKVGDGNRYALKIGFRYCTDDEISNGIVCRSDNGQITTNAETFSLLEHPSGEISLRSGRTGKYCRWNFLDSELLTCDGENSWEKFTFEFESNYFKI
jgi:hypothetical protein